MGVLDDAIREHIELKRAHGASEDDLRRQEQEALGPARRETQSPAQAEDEAVEPVAADAAPEAGGDESFDRQRTQVMMEAVTDDPAADAPVPLETRPHDQPDPEDFHEPVVPAEPEPFAAGPAEVQEVPYGLPDDEPELADVEDPPPPAPAFEEDDPFAGDEPFADPPGPAPAGEQDLEDEEDLAEDDDVLEETPEFLQETPEHDRLWFEQKPPRDFDFDDK